MQQQRNLLIFFLLAFALLVGTMQLRQRLWPTPQKEQEAEAVKKTRPETKKPADEEPRKLPPQPAVTPEAQLLALGDRSGDSRFHLYVQLDPLGAGVRTVVLNKFQQATSGGLPVPGEPLSLSPPEANKHQPSLRMYHYDPDDSKVEHPFDTLGRTVWKVVKQKNGKDVAVDTAAGKERQRVSFRAEAGGVIITKTYTLTAGDYHIGLSIDLERPRAKADAKPADKREIKFRYQLAGMKGLPVEGKWYTTVYRNAMVGAEDDRGEVYRDLQDLREVGLWGGGNPVEAKDGRSLRYAGVAVQYFASVIVVDNEQENQKFLQRAQATLETAVARGKVKSAALLGADRLVMLSEDGKTEQTIFIPPKLRAELLGVKEGTPVAVVYRPLTWNPERKETYKLATSIRLGSEASATHELWEDDVTVRVVTEAVELKPGDKVTHNYLLYNGPVKPSLLGQLTGEKEVDQAVVDRYADTLQLNTMTDSASPGRMGAFAKTIRWTYVVIKCTNLMHRVLGWLHHVVPSYGLCIILLTVLVRGLMFPLSRKQALMGMKMQELAPELKKLQEKHKDDKQALGMAQWELYRKHGVSPFGSCWVMLLQMPIFMGLYYALQESIQFRLAPFWPTWIKNLAAPDMLFRWGESIPLLSRAEDFGGFLYLGPYLNILPILAVALMIAQQKMLMPPPADEQQEMQQKMMKYMMIFFGLMFYKVAAGLTIYFIASSLWGFAERKLLPKAKLPKVGADSEKAAPTASIGSTAITTPSGVTPGKKPGRSKRKAERGRTAVVREEEATGLGRLRQRLRTWWTEVLEQAKKK
jgi:YidC/Oxa1 family membrane protein insertase